LAVARTEAGTTVREALAGTLTAAGVTSGFGLMGEDAATLLVTLVHEQGMRYVGARHENVAVTMADGYARTAQRLGVCVISLGPGITNAMTALTTVARGGNRVLVIAGDEAPAGPKHIDQAALLGAAGLATFTASTAAEAVPVLREAIAAAESGRPAFYGIVPHLLGQPVPAGAMAETVPAADALPPAPAPPAAELESVAALLSDRRLPLIIAGRGALGAGTPARLERLAEQIGALLGTTLLAKDAFRGHPLDLGLVGGFSSPRARALLKEVDAVLVFGASLNVFTTQFNQLFEGIPLVQFDTEPRALGAGMAITLGVVADSGLAASGLLDAMPASSRPERGTDDSEVRSLLGSPPSAAAADGEDGIEPTRLALALDRRLPESRTLITDAGHTFGFAAMNIRVPEPARYCPTMQFAAIAMGLGTALGAALGDPGSQAVLFIGDGALSMTLGDLETAVRERIPLIVVVMDDRSYGAERHFLDLEGDPNDLANFPELDFAAVAAGLGMESALVRSLDDLDDLDLATPRREPLLLDCKIDPTVRAEWLEEIAAASSSRYS
jgi:acetolactate synthase-1/2/3 large subunit